MPWIVEPPLNKPVLIDDGCRIVEVDLDGKFVRVIAKLHPGLTTHDAAVLSAAIENWKHLKHIRFALDKRTFPDEDEDPDQNDDVLTIVGSIVEKAIDGVSKKVKDSAIAAGE